MLKIFVFIFAFVAFATWASASVDNCPNILEKSQAEEFRSLVKSYSVRVCEGIEPTDHRSKEKLSSRSTTATKKVDRLTSLQRLFKWLNRMKTIWIDFPVFEKEKRPSEDFLSPCDVSEATVGEGRA